MLYSIISVRLFCLSPRPQLFRAVPLHLRVPPIPLVILHQPLCNPYGPSELPAQTRQALLA